MANMATALIDAPIFEVVLPAIAGVLVTYYLYAYFFLSPVSFDAPLEGVEGKKSKGKNAAAANVYSVLRANYHKYRKSFFKVKEPHGETLITPTKYVEELKALPQDVLAFQDALSEKMLSEYTLMSSASVGAHDRTFPNSITQNLTRSLNTLMKDIHDECAYAFETEIGPCDDWTEVNIFHKLVTIVALISGRVFIGPELNRDPEYMRCIIQFTMEIFVSISALQQIHPLLRPFYSWFGWIPELEAVHNSYASMRKIMGPVIVERAAAIAAGEPAKDMVTWNMMNSPPQIRNSVKVQAHSQLVASMAAIHTTSMTGSHVLYDLAARPELIAPLRKELEAVMAAEPVPYLTKTSTPKLKLLDSFCKESQRMNPLGPLTFVRKVKKTITLHDGTILPPGTNIAVPAAEIAHDETIFPDPDKFDPWRFAKLREQPGHESRHQFVSTGMDNLNFGHGNHACPGRFFANNELKVIITYVLEHYDIKMPEGEGRPKNIPTSGGIQPDTSKSLLMKRKSSSA